MNLRAFRLYRSPVRGWWHGFIRFKPPVPDQYGLTLHREEVAYRRWLYLKMALAFAWIIFLVVLAVRDCGLATAGDHFADTNKMVNVSENPGELEEGEINVGQAAMLHLWRASFPRAMDEGRGIEGNPPAMPILLAETGLASWYGPGYHGRPVSCQPGPDGKQARYDMNAMTAAHRTLPCGTLARVCRTDREACVVVTITDRGPFIPGRVVDLSRAAMERIGGIEHGVVPVKVEVLP